MSKVPERAGPCITGLYYYSPRTQNPDIRHITNVMKHVQGSVKLIYLTSCEVVWLYILCSSGIVPCGSSIYRLWNKHVYTFTWVVGTLSSISFVKSTWSACPSMCGRCMQDECIMCAIPQNVSLADLGVDQGIIDLLGKGLIVTGQKPLWTKSPAHIPPDIYPQDIYPWTNIP